VLMLAYGDMMVYGRGAMMGSVKEFNGIKVVSTN